MRTELFAALLTLLGCGALLGCSTSPYCEAYSQCGGDFTAGAQDSGVGVASADWSASAPDACIDQVPSPPEPPSLAYIPPRPAGIRAVEPSTIDWCSGLVINSGGEITAFDDGWYETLIKYDGWFPSIPLYTAELTIYVNNQYAVSLTQLVSQHTELSQTCLIAQGIVLSCNEIGDRLDAFVTERLASIAGVTAVVYRNDVNQDGSMDASDPICVNDGEGGCTCDYNVSLTSGAQGPWSAADGRITFFDADAAPPGRADYCVNGNNLELSGSKGTDLFNRNALKSLQLRRP